MNQNASPIVQTAAQWTSMNPILDANQRGLESDTGKEKIGDGHQSWKSLSYMLLAAYVPRLLPSGDLTGATDYANITALVNAFNNGGGIAANTPGGGTLYLAPGTFYVNQTVILYAGIYLEGAGPGGNVFSDTDPQLPFRGTVLKAAAGANCDVIQTANFAALTGVLVPSPYSTPNRFGVSKMVIDGNKANNASGNGITIYGQSYWLDRLVVQNCAGHGIYSEYGSSAGYDNESQWVNVRCTDNVGDGIHFLGPHDSVMANVFSARNGAAGITCGPLAGGITISNMHNWGNGTYNYDIQASGETYFSNCQCDSAGGAGNAGIRCLTGGHQWVGGSIYGTGAPGEVLVTLGDGTARTITNLLFRTSWFGVGPATVAVQYTNSVVQTGNSFQGSMTSSVANSNFVAGQGYTTTSGGGQQLPAGTLNVSSTALFPAAGTLYVGVTGSSPNRITYTGKTANTFTGCAGGTLLLPVGTPVLCLTLGAGINTTRDDFDLYDPSGLTSGNRVKGNFLNTLFWDQSTQFNANLTVNAPFTPGTGAGASPGNIYGGAGAPNIANSPAGSVYFRTDTAGVANQRLYIATAVNTWTGIL